MIYQSAIAIRPYPGKNMRNFLIGCRLLRQEHRVNNYKRVIDTYIILVQSIQNCCIKYSTQHQHFATYEKFMWKKGDFQIYPILKG
jgi:hypothetical protein